MHARRALSLALAACGACTTTRTLRTAPAPGMRVRVDFVERRNIDVVVGAGIDSVPFDGVTLVTGRVARTSGDTLWLEQVYVDSAGKQLRPGPDGMLRVTGIGHDAEVRELRFSAVESTAAVLGTLVGLAAVALILALVIPPVNST